MTDAVSREAVLDILTDEGWLGDSLRRIRALPAVRVQLKPTMEDEAEEQFRWIAALKGESHD